MKKRYAAFLFIICLLLSFNGCTGKTADGTQEENASGEIVITDMVGREVRIRPGSYRRVVCIGAGALRLYTYVGDISFLCGIEDIDNPSLAERPKMFDASPRPYLMAYGESWTELPSCGTGGPNAQAAEAEKILSCAPDIVISMYEDADREDALEKQLGVPVVTLRSGPQGVFAPEFSESLTLLGTIFARVERTEELISFLEGEKAELSRRTESIAEEDKPAVYVCGLGNWGTTNHLYTAENYAPFTAAHIKNALSGLGMKGIGAIEEEKFVSLGEAADILFIDAAAVKNIAPLYAADPTMFDAMKARQSGEVYLEMAYNAYYTNYEIALANTWYMAKTVYPDAFADIDITAKLNEITKLYLGKELAEEIYACPASCGGYQKLELETFFTE